MTTESPQLLSASPERFIPLPRRAVCRRCGSDDLCRDAAARWSEAENAWQLASLFDESTCQACGADGAEIVELIPVAPPVGARVRIATRPRIGGDRFAGRTRTTVRVNSVCGGLYVRLDPRPRERVDKVELVDLAFLDVPTPEAGR